MPRKYSKPSLDANHKEIVKNAPPGVYVRSLAQAGDGMFDTVTCNKYNQVCFIEIKNLQGNTGNHISFKQLKFASEWPAYCGFAIDQESFNMLAENPSTWALTCIEKDIIKAWCEENKDKDIGYTAFMELIGREYELTKAQKTKM